MNTSEAIEAIIRYETLPPQIDYTKPYWEKAVKAGEFLDALPELEKENAYAEIQFQVNLYNTPGDCGYSAAEMDSMF